MNSQSDLTRLFNPKSVALVGASDKNPWCGLVLKSLMATGYAGRVHLVNKNGNRALGRDTFTSCAAIGEAVDAAFIAVPAAALDDALADLAAGGIRFGVVVTSGFAEMGEEGTREQARVFEKAKAMGLSLLGPNSLGFVNAVSKVAFTAIPVPDPFIRDGAIGLISQSGATTSALQEYAARQGVGLSYAVALGNEAVVDLAQVITFLVEDKATRAIAIYAESIRDTKTFIAACELALAAAKPIIVLKVGAGELAAEVAQAHTGALVGDDRVFNAVCRRYGMIRVESLEQLILTADLLAFTNVMDERPIAALSISGGACGMIADMADRAGVPFARLAAETTAALTAILPPYGAANNPLDITGAAMADTGLFTRAIMALDADPGVGLIVCLHEAPVQQETLHPISRLAMAAIGAGFAGAAKICLLAGQTAQAKTEFTRSFAGECGIPYVTNSMIEAIKSIASGRAWSDRVRRYRAEEQATPSTERVTARPLDERQVLNYLAGRGIPVIPSQIVNSAAQAATCAASLGGAVALKILSPDIAHKTEAGGVILNVADAAAASDAYDAIIANVTNARPDAKIEGVLISPMRRRDAELFVGVARDPLWGLVLACGVGGIWVELLADVSLSTLPVTPQIVLDMLSGLKAEKLLNGYRGSPPVDRAALAKIIAEIGDAALALGPDLMSLEINPLNVGPAGIEALDGLAVWA